VTLRLGVMPVQCRGGYHASAKDEPCFCIAKGWSRPCLRWAISPLNEALHPTLRSSARITLRSESQAVRFYTARVMNDGLDPSVTVPLLTPTVHRALIAKALEHVG
jgi:hypothetical protein